MQQQPIIIGIDPGMTSAYAVLSLEGKLLKLKSSKELHLRTLLQEITATGKVIAIGSDVKHAPGLIEKFSARVSAKMILPEEDMKVGFKERVTEQYKPRDDHQRDALAAALHAYTQLRPALLKVDQALKEIGKEHLADDVKTAVVQGKSIAQALTLLEKTDDVNIQQKKKKRRSAFKQPSRYIEENSLLRKQNEAFQQKIVYLNHKIQQLLKKIELQAAKKAGSMIIFKDQKIAVLKEQVKALEKQGEQKEQELREVTSLLLESRGKVIAKKCKTLSWEEIHDRIEKDDVLLVDDVNSFSEKALQHMKGKITTIITRKQPAKELLKQGFTFINAAHLPIKETATWALVEQEALERERKKKDILAAVIQEYQEERRSLL